MLLLVLQEIEASERGSASCDLGGSLGRDSESKVLCLWGGQGAALSECLVGWLMGTVFSGLRTGR